MANSDDKKSDPAPKSIGSQSTSNESESAIRNGTGGTPPMRGSNDRSVSKMGNKNALVHGVHSKFAVLPWESEDDFNELHQGFKDEWKPNGFSEEQAVWDLTYNTWLKWRLLTSTQLRFFQSTVSEELKKGAVTLEDIVRHQTDVPKHASGALSTVRCLIKDLNSVFEIIRNRPYWTDTSDGKRVQHDLMMLQKDVGSLIEQTKENVVSGVEHLVRVVKESASRFDQAYQTEEIEKQLDLMAKIDARIEKILRRLTSLKEYKRAAGLSGGPAIVESPSVIPEISLTKVPAEGGENTVVNDISSANADPVTDAAPEHRENPKD
jgi:hypothetical protein